MHTASRTGGRSEGWPSGTEAAARGTGWRQPGRGGGAGSTPAAKPRPRASQLRLWWKPLEGRDWISNHAARGSPSTALQQSCPLQPCPPRRNPLSAGQVPALPVPSRPVTGAPSTVHDLARPGPPRPQERRLLPCCRAGRGTGPEPPRRSSPAPLSVPRGGLLRRRPAAHPAEPRAAPAGRGPGSPAAAGAAGPCGGPTHQSSSCGSVPVGERGRQAAAGHRAPGGGAGGAAHLRSARRCRCAGPPAPAPPPAAGRPAAPARCSGGARTAQGPRPAPPARPGPPAAAGAGGARRAAPRRGGPAARPGGRGARPGAGGSAAGAAAAAAPAAQSPAPGRAGGRRARPRPHRRPAGSRRARSPAGPPRPPAGSARGPASPRAAGLRLVGRAGRRRSVAVRPGAGGRTRGVGPHRRSRPRQLLRGRSGWPGCHTARLPPAARASGARRASPSAMSHSSGALPLPARLRSVSPPETTTHVSTAGRTYPPISPHGWTTAGDQPGP